MGKLAVVIGTISRRKPLDIAETVDASEIQTDRDSIEALHEVNLNGSLTVIDSDYLFQGTLSGTFRRECDRCLVPAEKIIKLNVSWLYEPADNEDEERDIDFNGIEDEEVEEEENIPYHHNNDTIDLATPAYEELLFAAPSKLYCKEDCQGLCPLCGTNWNNGTCECQLDEEPEIKNTGLSGLKEMFPDLPTEPPEE